MKDEEGMAGGNPESKEANRTYDECDPVTGTNAILGRLNIRQLVVSPGWLFAIPIIMLNKRVVNVFPPLSTAPFQP